MLPITTLLRAMTEEEVFERFLEILRTLGMPVDKWRKGAAIRVIIRVCARLYAVFTVLVAAFIASGFLETATAEWLTKLAKNVYGVERRTATFAREKIRLTNAGAGLFEDNVIGSVTVFNPVSKKAYRNAELFTLSPFETKEVVFEAVEVGSASAAAAGTISELETNLTGVTVTNLRAFIGLDEENDEELRQACKDKLGSLSVRGPRSAYAFAVREARLDDGNFANVNRHRISTSSSTGKVYVWIASATGTPLPADIAAVADSIERRARPDTVTVIVQGVTEVAVTRVLDVWVKRRDGVNAADVKSTIETAFVREGVTYPIGGLAKSPSTQGKLYADWLAGVAKQAWPDVFDVDGTGADVNLAAGQVALLQITANVRLQDAG
ncbi:MAG: hypothetical protein QOG85_26 [Gaiellaceae bacterium]|nr:hypothetical protein [Gaiellaceae bacterium]